MNCFARPPAAVAPSLPPARSRRRGARDPQARWSPTLAPASHPGRRGAPPAPPPARADAGRAGGMTASDNSSRAEGAYGDRASRLWRSLRAGGRPPEPNRRTIRRRGRIVGPGSSPLGPYPAPSPILRGIGQPASPGEPDRTRGGGRAAPGARLQSSLSAHTQIRLRRSQ